LVSLLVAGQGVEVEIGGMAVEGAEVFEVALEYRSVFGHARQQFRQGGRGGAIPGRSKRQDVLHQIVLVLQKVVLVLDVLFQPLEQGATAIEFCPQLG